MGLRDDGSYWRRSATDKASLVAVVMWGRQVSYGNMGINYVISGQVQRRSKMGNWVVRDAVRSEPVSPSAFPA